MLDLDSLNRRWSYDEQLSSILASESSPFMMSSLCVTCVHSGAADGDGGSSCSEARDDDETTASQHLFCAILRPVFGPDSKTFNYSKIN